jgi:hypothetical protein
MLQPATIIPATATIVSFVNRIMVTPPKELGLLVCADQEQWSCRGIAPQPLEMSDVSRR